MTNTELTNFLKLHAEILAAVRPHIGTYFLSTPPKTSWDRRARERLGANADWDLRVAPEGIQFSAEFNDACNCHPEYVHYIDTIDWATVQEMMASEDWTPRDCEGAVSD